MHLESPKGSKARAKGAPGGKVKPAGGEDYGLHLSDSSEISFSLSLSLAINLPFWSYLILSDPSVYVYLTSILTNNLTS